MVQKKEFTRMSQTFNFNEHDIRKAKKKKTTEQETTQEKTTLLLTYISQNGHKQDVFSFSIKFHVQTIMLFI